MRVHSSQSYKVKLCLLIYIYYPILRSLNVNKDPSSWNTLCLPRNFPYINPEFMISGSDM